MKSLKPQEINNTTSQPRDSLMVRMKKLVRNKIRGFVTISILIPDISQQCRVKTILRHTARLRRAGFQVREMLVPSQCNNAGNQHCALLSAMKPKHSNFQTPKAASDEARHNASLLAAVRGLLADEPHHLESYAVTPNGQAHLQPPTAVSERKGGGE